MPSTCPVKHAAPAEKDSTSSESAGGNNACPYRHDKGQRPTTSMPANSELPPNQRPTPGQRKLLSTERVQSTIPRSEGDDTWQYPSQQMFYNAMKRKGYAPSEDDMDSVVAIHNAVNERTWQEILKWEKAHCEECPTPKLLRFQGRPADLSPKVSSVFYTPVAVCLHARQSLTASGEARVCAFGTTPRVHMVQAAVAVRLDFDNRVLRLCAHSSLNFRRG